MPHPKHSLTLAQTALGDLVQVQEPDDPLVSRPGVPLGLRKGEVVQCLENDGGGVLVARADGSRVLVPIGSARKVGIRWFPDSTETDGAADGVTPEEGFHARSDTGQL